METTEPTERYRLVDRTRQQATDFAEAVTTGLTATRKTLPCRFLYDATGSDLFDEICSLPEYYLTRSERQILLDHATSIVADLPADLTLVELGSGSATKTRVIVEALLRERAALRFTPIDVSKSALVGSADEMLEGYPELSVIAVAAEYREGLEVVKQEHSSPELVLWLGSSIGNLSREDAAAFLRKVARSMSLTDRLLIGIDLRKATSVLESAYDDSARVTARFNRNILKRVNTELGGRFDLDSFRHRAQYDDREGRVEMHLVSKTSQSIVIEDLSLEIEFEEGETIHTESSHKYSPEEIAALVENAGLQIDGQWFDQQKRFSVNRMKKAH